MNLDDLQTGDVLFVEGKGFISEAIKKVTKSSISHVGIIYNKNLVFETHYNTHARLNPLDLTYGKSRIYVYRPLPIIDVNRIQKLCESYNGTKYSKWDILTNFLFSWVKPIKRRKLIGKLGTKKMMICSEIVAKILYEYSKADFSYLDVYEGLRPDGLLELGLENKWERVI